MDINTLIQNGVQSLSKKDHAAAREYLKMAIQLDPRNESAWMWMSMAVENDRERIFCLNQVLKLNPNHPTASLELKILTTPKRSSAPASSPPSPTTAESKVPSVLPIVAATTSPTPAQPLNLIEPSPLVTSPPRQVAVPSTSQEIICPICKQSDRIQRVISIVEEGTHHTSGTETTTSETSISGRQHHWGQNEWSIPTYRGSTNISGSATTTDTTHIDLTRQSVLASQLMPPERPAEPVKDDTSCVDLLMMIGIPGLGLLVSLIDFFSSSSFNLFYGRGYIKWSAFIWLPVIVVIGEVLLYFLWQKPASQAAEIKYDAEMLAYQRTQLTDWHKKMVIWEKLFYCARNHVVFDPQSRLSCDPTKLHAFLETIALKN